MQNKQSEVQGLLEKSRAKRPGPSVGEADVSRTGTATTAEDVNYDESAEFLLSTGMEGEGAGVRGILHSVRRDVATAAINLENSAQVVKRNAIRYSKLNQIANEYERLDSFKNRVREASYGLLRNCLVNYQITNEID